MSESTYFEPTYSGDERIETYLRNLREKENQDIVDNQRERCDFFDKAFIEKLNPVFKLPGLHFLYFTHKKIKFYFCPSEVSGYVNNTLKFYCKLIYHKKYGWWSIKRDSFPGNYKRKVYSLFHKERRNIIEDEYIIAVINKIHKMLLEWTEFEETRLQKKYEEYRRGKLEDLYFHSDELEILFEDDEKSEILARRKAILKRMLPPEERENFVFEIEW